MSVDTSRDEKGSSQFESVGLKGSRRHMKMNAAPIRNRDGMVVQPAVTCDITEVKRADQSCATANLVLPIRSPRLSWPSVTTDLQCHQRPKCVLGESRFQHLIMD
jgi:hypothetical protein